VNFVERGVPATLTKDVTLCTFRVAQEALRNCVKHSEASFAQVVMERTPQAVRLSVTDNGCGFETNCGVMEKGLGFISMKERLRLVDGEMQIYSRPAYGTRIQVTVPLRAENERRARIDNDQLFSLL
jgi:signal transduction histidine kinase